MIFFYHLLSWIGASLGLLLAYGLHKKFNVPNWLIFFIVFLGIGMFIHLFFDATVNLKENFINSYINLGLGKNATLEEKLSKIFIDMGNLVQPVIK